MRENQVENSGKKETEKEIWDFSDLFQLAESLQLDYEKGVEIDKLDDFAKLKAEINNSKKVSAVIYKKHAMGG